MRIYLLSAFINSSLDVLLKMIKQIVILDDLHGFSIWIGYWHVDRQVCLLNQFWLWHIQDWIHLGSTFRHHLRSLLLRCLFRRCRCLGSRCRIATRQKVVKVCVHIVLKLKLVSHVCSVFSIESLKKFSQR